MPVTLIGDSVVACAVHPQGREGEGLDHPPRPDDTKYEGDNAEFVDPVRQQDRVSRPGLHAAETTEFGWNLNYGVISCGGCIIRSLLSPGSW